MNKQLRTICILILVLLAIFLFTYKLGNYSFWDNDEPLYTGMAKHMTTSGDWVTLQFSGENWFCHPPLYMWLTALTSYVNGWNEFTGRIWSSIFAVGIILLVFFIGEKLVSLRGGFLSAIVALTTIQIFVQSHLANLDTALIFFLAASIFALYIGAVEEKKNYYIGAWILMGLATLDKGIFGFLFPLLIIFLYLLMKKELPKFKKIFLSPGIIIFLLLAIPWYAVEIYLHGNKFIDEVFLFYTVQRLTTPILNQKEPIYFYIPVFILGFFPWIFFFPQAFAYIINLVRQKSKEALQSQALSKAGSDMPILLIIWFAVVFISFTVIRTKLPNYILIIYPACALMMGKYWDSLLAQKKLPSSFIISGSFFLIFVPAIIFIFRKVALSIYPAEFENFKGQLVILAVELLAGAVLTYIFIFINRVTTFIALALTGYLLFINIAVLTVKADYYKPMKPIALALSKLIKENDLLYMDFKLEGKNSLVFYSGHDRNYFYDKSEIKNIMSQQKRVFLLIKEKDCNELFSDTDMSPVIVGRGKDILVLSNR
ncbi:MAG: glycosyltransferase family 39 protein [Firmicutes bacterium]|nr:glycosyltransferase family 39 protein [Bacillota bacterium]